MILSVRWRFQLTKYRHIYSKRMISGDYIRGFTVAIDLAIKDATHAQSLVKETTKNDARVEGQKFELKKT